MGSETQLRTGFLIILGLVVAFVLVNVFGPSRTESVKSTVLVGTPVKKSTNGVCHATGSPWFELTKTFQGFESLDACLDSGGRKPVLP